MNYFYNNLDNDVRELINLSAPLIAMFFVAFAAAIALRIVLTICVKKDCEAIGVKNKWVWMILAFLIPVSVIVYYFIRPELEKTVPKYCFSCGSTSMPNALVCQHCGTANIADMIPADAEKKKKGVKNLIITAIVIIVVNFIAVSTLFTIGVLDIVDHYGYENSENFLEDFVDNYDDDQNDGYDYDDDDIGDDFKNFGQGEEQHDDNYFEYNFDDDDLQDFYEGLY